MERTRKKVATCEKSSEDKGKEGSREGIQEVANFYFKYKVGWNTSLNKPGVVGKERILKYQKSDIDC